MSDFGKNVDLTHCPFFVYGHIEINDFACHLLRCGYLSCQIHLAVFAAAKLSISDGIASVEMLKSVSDSWVGNGKIFTPLDHPILFRRERLVRESLDGIGISRMV